MSAAATTGRATLPRNRPLPTFFDNLDSFAEAPQGVAKLRELILDLAVRGKLVEQDENDEPAGDLLEAIDAEKQELAKNGAIRKPKQPSEITDDETPFDLPLGWEWSRLGTVCVLENGDRSKNYPNKSALVDDGIPFINAGHLQNGRVEMSEMNFITEERFEILRSGKVRRDDILFCLRGSLGKSAIVGDLDKGAIASSLVIVRLFNGVLPSFVLKYFSSPLSSLLIERFDNGTAQPNLSATDLAKFVFPLPPLSEQRRIVSKVDGLMSLCDELESRGRERVRLRDRANRSCLDRLVSSRSRRDLSSAWQRLSDHFEVLYDTPETLAHLRQSILQLAVQGKLVPQDPNDEPASGLLDQIAMERQQEGFPTTRFSEKALAETVERTTIRDGWAVAALAQVALTIVDCPHSTPKWTQSGKICVRTNQFRPGMLDLSDVRFVSEATYLERIQRLTPCADDILYSREGGILGIACRVPRNTELCLGQRMMLIRPPSAIDAGFLELVLNSPLISDIARGKTTGGAAPRVNVATVKAYPIPLPPLAEQKRIVAKVDQLLSQCDELSARLRDRQSATQQLLTATIHNLLVDTKEKER